MGPVRSDTNPDASELTADETENIANAPAARVALSSFSRKMDAWWNISAVVIRLGELSDNDSSQKPGEL